MNRELFLIRHAEAEISEYNQKDKERYLTPQGSQDAMRLGKVIRTIDITPDYILSSSAMRTRQTSGYICEQIGIDSNTIHFSDDLYESSMRIMLNSINELDDTYATVFVVAHNPAISYIAEYLTGEIIGNIAPGGMVHLNLSNLSWSTLAQDKARLVKYFDPKDL